MRRLLARATIILFALRALVPAGFMPDLGALGAGHLDIMLCTAPGDVPVARDPGEIPAAPHKSPGADCPFGVALVKSFVAPVASALPPRVARVDVVTHTEFAAGFPPPSQGPPLGSRAPPVLPV